MICVLFIVTLGLSFDYWIYRYLELVCNQSHKIFTLAYFLEIDFATNIFKNMLPVEVISNEHRLTKTRHSSKFCFITLKILGTYFNQFELNINLAK